MAGACRPPTPPAQAAPKAAPWISYHASPPLPPLRCGLGRLGGASSKKTSMVSPCRGPADRRYPRPAALAGPRPGPPWSTLPPS